MMPIVALGKVLEAAVTQAQMVGEFVNLVGLSMVRHKVSDWNQIFMHRYHFECLVGMFMGLRPSLGRSAYGSCLAFASRPFCLLGGYSMCVCTCSWMHAPHDL